jgi:hypothetical protein
VLIPRYLTVASVGVGRAANAISLISALVLLPNSKSVLHAASSDLRMLTQIHCTYQHLLKASTVFWPRPVSARSRDEAEYPFTNTVYNISCQRGLTTDGGLCNCLRKENGVRYLETRH